MAEYETLLTEQEDGVLTLTLNRPKANAFNNQMIEELLDALKRAGKEESVRCVVLTGAGRFFSAGQDVTAFAEADGRPDFRGHLQKTYNRLVMRLRQLEKPVVAAINGPVAGAALGVALATDLRLAAESAQFFFGFTGIGLTADSGTSLTLPLLIGLTRATYMAFTNDPLSAEEALQYGLVNRVVADEELMPATMELARRLAQGPTRALGLTKRAFNHAMLGALEAALDYEAYLQQIAGETEDHKEGLQAFLEKRPPQYKGA